MWLKFYLAIVPSMDERKILLRLGVFQMLLNLQFKENVEYDYK